MPVNYNNQFENTILQTVDLGEILKLAVQARNDAKTDGLGIVDDAEVYLSALIKAGCIQGEFATKVSLLTVDQKAKILDYIMKFHIDWDFIANKVLKEYFG